MRPLSGAGTEAGRREMRRLSGVRGDVKIEVGDRDEKRERVLVNNKTVSSKRQSDATSTQPPPVL